MPNQPKTPVRNVRVAEDLWRDAQRKAADEGTTVSAVVVEALRRYTSSDDAPPPD